MEGAFEWSFDYRYYAKKRMIQLKPKHDKGVHFSLLWQDKARPVEAEKFKEAHNACIAYLEAHDWKVAFTVVKVCENCTYGHMDEAFEEVLLSFRNALKLCCKKDLPLDDPRHMHLTEGDVVVVKEPVFLHISHSRSSDEKFNTFLQTAERGTRMTMNISIRE